jgi:hypothetical protein
MKFEKGVIMTIARKMLLLVVVVMVGIVVLAGLGQFQMGRVFTAANYANINTVPSLLELSKAANAQDIIRVTIWQHLAQTEAGEMAKLEQKIEEQSKIVAESLKKYEKEDITDDKDRQNSTTS